MDNQDQQNERVEKDLESVQRGIRFRYVYMGLFGILSLILLYVTDPDNKLLSGLAVGAGFVATVTLLMSAVLYVTLMHLSRKGVIDYVNLSEFFTKALQTPTGAGLALIGVGLTNVAIALVIIASVIGTR